MHLAVHRMGYGMLTIGLLVAVSADGIRAQDSARSVVISDVDTLTTDDSPGNASRSASSASPVDQEIAFVSEINERTACDCDACRVAAPPKTVPGCKTCCRGKTIDWAKFPATIHPMARTGFFQIPPTQGQAYYSLWDRLEGVQRPAAPKSGYASTALNPAPYFDADWRYVETIAAEDRTWVEQMKRMHLNDCLMLSVGGGYWVRFMNEHHSRLTRNTNDFTLNRFRLYTDWWYLSLIHI